MATRQEQIRPATRMSGEDRRQQIIDVAIQLFSQRGFRGTTTREIALAAGVNEAIIFRHFATKHDLYSAIIDQKACTEELQSLEVEVEEAMRRGDDRRVFETIAFHILEKHEHDDAFMRLLFYSALEGHELSDIFFRNQVSRHHRRMAEYIRKRVADGAFRRVDPLTATRAFFGMVIYHAQTNKLYGRDHPANELRISNRQAAERFTDLFLGSLTNLRGSSRGFRRALRKRLG
ncbi:MAG TPA: TetR family transcriptional regulator [Blastocatellia bacterium]|nr:TetR family transcriptional regulator [Blastocatellia bacterium]